MHEVQSPKLSTLTVQGSDATRLPLASGDVPPVFVGQMLPSLRSIWVPISEAKPRRRTH